MARSNIKRFCARSLYSQILSNAGQGARARTNGVFILRCTFLDLECKRCFYLAVYLSRSGVQNIGLTSAPALETELELRAFCLVSILPRHYTLTHRRGFVNLPGSDVTRDPGRRKGKIRAREQLKQSAGLHQKHLKLLKSCWLWSESLEGTSVHLERDNSSKAKNLSALWIIFPIEV